MYNLNSVSYGVIYWLIADWRNNAGVVLNGISATIYG